MNVHRLTGPLARCAVIGVLLVAFVAVLGPAAAAQLDDRLSAQKFAAVAGADDFVSVTPSRVLDTRDGNGGTRGPLRGGDIVSVQVSGRGGVPTQGAGAVALNITSTEAASNGFVTVWPSAAAKPGSPSMAAPQRANRANLVIVALGTDGKVNLASSSSSSHLIADVAGWFPISSALRAIAPTTAMDTRSGAAPRPVGPSSTTKVKVTGVGGVAADADAVFVNVTVIDPSASGYITVYPSGAARPLSSNINMTPGRTVSNVVFAKVGVDGSIDVFNFAGTAQVVVDITGWVPRGSGLTGVVPSRVLDTRSDGSGPLDRRAPRLVSLADRGGVPARGVGAVLLNVTATESSSDGYLTVYPSGVDRPLASNLNLRANETVPNVVMAKVGPDGAVMLFGYSDRVHVIVDVIGWLPGDSAATSTPGLKLEPRAGTVVASPSSVGSVTGSSLAGAIVVLSSGATAPMVGGYLAVGAGGASPDGVMGRVASVTRRPDGSTEVTLTPARLEDAFSDIETSFRGPLTFAPRNSRQRHGAQCQSQAGANVGFDLDLTNANGEFDFDLSERYVKVKITADLVASVSVNASATYSCTITSPPLFTILGITTAELSAGLNLTVSASANATMSVSVPTVLGFETRGGSTQNLSEMNLSGQAELQSSAIVTVSAEPFAELAFKVFGVAGIVVRTGINLAGAFTPPGCVTVTAAVNASATFEVGRWGFDWSTTVGSKSFGPLTLLQRGECGRWVGTVTYERLIDVNVSDAYESYRSTWRTTATGTEVDVSIDYKTATQSSPQCPTYRDSTAGTATALPAVLEPKVIVDPLSVTGHSMTFVLSSTASYDVKVQLGCCSGVCEGTLSVQPFIDSGNCVSGYLVPISKTATRIQGKFSCTDGGPPTNTGPPGRFLTQSLEVDLQLVTA
jgi:hypothetical protein